MHIWLLMSVFTTGRCWSLDGSPNVCVTTIVQTAKSSRVANWPHLRFNFFQPVHPCHCPRNVNYIRLIFQRRRNRPEPYNGRRLRIIVLLLFQFFFLPIRLRLAFYPVIVHTLVAIMSRWGKRYPKLIVGPLAYSPVKKGDDHEISYCGIRDVGILNVS